MIACFYCVPFILGGCNGSPEAVSKLAIDPTDAAAAAFELYDKNSDRILSKDEIEACRGLAASVKAFDENRDGEISVEELENRIDFWVNCPARMVSIMCTVKMDGRPLSGATVRFVPEPFLADGIKPASGETGTSGATGIVIAEEDLPEALRGLPGMQLGLYTVEITHPKKKIPAKYNSQTTLGCEVSPRTQVGPIVFSLSSQ